MKVICKLLILLLFLTAAALLLIRSGVMNINPDTAAESAAVLPIESIPQPSPVPTAAPLPAPEASASPSPCLHARHDPDTLLCLDCGQPQTHHFRNGSCSGCGLPFDFHDSFLPKCFYQAPPEELRGRLELHYLPCGEAPVKALVYLPCHYGEDETRRYNVFVLLPTINGSAETCMTLPFYTPYGECTMQTLYDNLFLSGACEPAIVVSLGFIDSFELTENVIRSELLPMLAENYRTWADSPLPEDLCAAREHFAIGGISNGALQTCYTGLERMVDLCANFAVLAGALRQAEIVDALNGSFSEYPLNMVFIAYGEKDPWAQKAAQPLYERLAEEVERCVPGENLVLHVLPGLEHNWSAFHLEILDALLLCFPNE